MRTFLVESYLTTRDESELETVVRQARAVENALWIRYLGSLVLLEDEVCFHVFEAPSAGVLLAAADKAELLWERVAETLWRPGSGA